MIPLSSNEIKFLRDVSSDIDNNPNTVISGIKTAVLSQLLKKILPKEEKVAALLKPSTR